jgi:sulfonate transport system substrate-binding protein
MKRQFLKTVVGLAAGLAIAAVGQPALAEYNPKLLRIGFQKSASLLTLLKAQGRSKSA